MDAGSQTRAGPPPPGEALRLHIGGEVAKEGWKILNAQARPWVDYVGTCVDLSRFAPGSVEEIYASHVYEHLDYQTELPRALMEAHRVLRPGGVIRIGVPDLDVLCKLLVQPGLSFDERVYVMRVMFGGQTDPFDFHKVGLNLEILSFYLKHAGFSQVKRVSSFGLFPDTTSLRFRDRPLSLNVTAVKEAPRRPQPA